MELACKIYKFNNINKTQKQTKIRVLHTQLSESNIKFLYTNCLSTPLFQITFFAVFLDNNVVEPYWHNEEFVSPALTYIDI